MKIRNGFVSNSSSESFLCRTNYTVEETKNILQKMLDFYNEIFKIELTFEDVFVMPYISTKEYLEDMKDYDSYLNFKENDVGRVVIDSMSDNSIPYPLFDMIEEKFDAERIHLG